MKPLNLPERNKDYFLEMLLWLSLMVDITIDGWLGTISIVSLLWYITLSIREYFKS